MNNINNSDWQRFDCDGVELVISTQTGESFATVRGYARMSNKAQSTVQSRVDRMFEGKNFNKTKATTTTGLQTVKLIDVDTILEWLAKDNPSKIKVVINLVKEVTGRSLELPSFPTQKKKKCKNLEKEVQIKLAESLNGVMEVQCKTGIADILTDTEIIEVKTVKDWKHAIGQVLIYQLEYPDKKARIHLFEECSEEFKQMVISFASRLNITATFEN